MKRGRVVCGRRALALLVALAAPAACGTPSRRIPARVVDEPITLPDNLRRASVSHSATLEDADGEFDWWLGPGFAYGITDRLQLTDGLGLSVALLDDAPAASGAPGKDALALAVTAGLTGFGVSSTENFIASYQLGAQIRKRIGSSLRLSASLWDVSQVSGLRHESSYLAAVGVVVQATGRLALDIDVYERRNYRTLTPSDRWTSRTFGVAPGLTYRPWHWFSLGLDLDLTVVRRPRYFVEVTPETPVPPTGSFERPTRVVTWLVVTTAFYW